MRIERSDGVAILAIDTPRNNAVNPDFIRECHGLLDAVEADDAIRALVVTSTHKSLFSPGADLPFLIELAPHDLRAYFEGVTGLVRRKFGFPKPKVCALNGHAVAAGCFMALTGDYRFMVRGGYYIGLMEIDLGLPTFAGVVEMMSHVLGGRIAERVLYAGENFRPEQALELGLVDELVDRDELLPRALERARLLGSKPPGAYETLKRYSRKPVVDRMRQLDATSVDEVLASWFTADTQRLLRAAVERLATRSDRRGARNGSA